MDIDSQNFNPKNYVLNLIKQNSIKQLIRQNNEIEEQIKVHDHQIQSLVFENYNKFISSIDTVREMKDNICKVDDKLKFLETAMQKIQGLAVKIDDTFAIKRKEIQKLDTINKDLQKLKNLCEFPHILKQDLIHYKSLSETRVLSQLSEIFNNSVKAYEACYVTLVKLKDQPLIAPIYKDSAGKIDQMRSIFKALQVQLKSKVSNQNLRILTKKLLTIAEDQVSVLRIYFHSWKDRLSESFFKGNSNDTNENSIPDINEDLWHEFNLQFTYLYQEIYSKLDTENNDIALHINNFTKEIFIWALNNYADLAPVHCHSLKGYVHANHVAATNLNRPLALLKSKAKRQDQFTLLEMLSNKMQERMQSLGISILCTSFAKVKLQFVRQILQSKKKYLSSSQDQQPKDLLTKYSSSLKETLLNHYRQLLDDMQFLRNNYALVFKTQEKFEQIIHQQVQSFIKAVATLVAYPSCVVSEQIHLLFYPSTVKPHRKQRTLVQQATKALAETEETSTWFVVAHTFLSVLDNYLAKKIIQNTQKYIQITKNYDYGQVFCELKKSLNANLLAFANYFSSKVAKKSTFPQQIEIINSFIESLNEIFPDYKKNLIKKPSFLAQENSFSIEAELLTVKKLRLITNRGLSDLASVLSYFIRKTLKHVVIQVRAGNSRFGQSDIYSLVQICFQLSGVQEEAQTAAFYYLIQRNWTDATWIDDYKTFDEKYNQHRK